MHIFLFFHLVLDSSENWLMAVTELGYGNLRSAELISFISQYLSLLQTIESFNNSFTLREIVLSYYLSISGFHSLLFLATELNG